MLGEESSRCLPLSKLSDVVVANRVNARGSRYPALPLISRIPGRDCAVLSTRRSVLPGNEGRLARRMMIGSSYIDSAKSGVPITLR